MQSSALAEFELVEWLSSFPLVGRFSMRLNWFEGVPLRHWHLPVLSSFGVFAS